MRLSLLFLAALLWTDAAAHGGMPRATHTYRSATHPETTWILTDNQGILADLKDGFRWLCEDAIAPMAGVRGLKLLGPDGSRWLVATTQGLFESTNGGCDFGRVPGEVGSHHLRGLWSLSGGRLLTASASEGVYNDVYVSDDAGQTWRSIGMGLVGKTLNLATSGRPGAPIYLHTTRGIYRSLDWGASFASLGVRIDGRPVSPEQILGVYPSPTERRILLMALANGSRTRFIRSDDEGERWQVVYLADSPETTLMFDSSGQEILAFGRSGVAWRSADSGLNWREAEAVPPTLGCLKHGPDGTLYGCADPYRGGPWMLGRSTDFGRTWQEELSRIEDASERWDCGPDAAGTQCCRGLCPGDQNPVACGQPTVGELPARCEPEERFPLVDLMEEETNPVDAAAPGDAANLPADGTLAQRDTGCAAVGGPGPFITEMMLGLLVLLMGFQRRT